MNETLPTFRLQTEHMAIIRKQKHLWKHEIRRSAINASLCLKLWCLMAQLFGVQANIRFVYMDYNGPDIINAMQNVIAGHFFFTESGFLSNTIPACAGYIQNTDTEIMEPFMTCTFFIVKLSFAVLQILTGQAISPHYHNPVTTIHYRHHLNSCDQKFHLRTKGTGLNRSHQQLNIFMQF